MKQAVLILAHGSRDAGARLQYRRLAELMVARLPEVPVEFAVLEFPGQDLSSIGQAVGRLIEAGVERIVALPYFLFAAGHVGEDLPGELAQAAAGSGVRLAYQPPLGVDPRLLDVFDDRAREAEATLPPRGSSPTAMLLIGAGTSDPEANADLYRSARLLWERRRFDFVEVSFVSLTAPALPEAIRRCQVLGVKRLIAVPYFLNTGVLSRRISARLDSIRQESPELAIALSQEIGLHEALLDLLTDRARVALRHPVDGLGLPACARAGSAWSCWLDLAALEA